MSSDEFIPDVRVVTNAGSRMLLTADTSNKKAGGCAELLFTPRRVDISPVQTLSPMQKKNGAHRNGFCA